MGKKVPLNKDFIQRLKSGRCKIVGLRVLELCAFLDVDPYESEKSELIAREFKELERLIQQHPELEKHLVNLVRNISNLAKSNFSKH
ncbi:hypothetical protein [Neisseria arctica]|nr:hypothetical protein [Neisseria arctica]UOO85716.1 hypothetical protein LVJ86_05600 [Neisseria arctica]